MDVQQMRKLKREHSVWLQENPQAGNKIVEVGDLGKHVVAKNQIGATTLSNEFLCDLRAEETYERWHAFFGGHLGDVGGGLNTEHWHLLADKVLEQVTIVAGDFHDEAAAIERESPGHFVAVVFAVL